MPALRLFVVTPFAAIVLVCALAWTVGTMWSWQALLAVGLGASALLAAEQERRRRQPSLRIGLVAAGAAAMFVVETAALLFFLFRDFES